MTAMTRRNDETKNNLDAKAPPALDLPLFYKTLAPLNSGIHASLSVQTAVNYRFAAKATGVPVILSEAALAQAHYPIVFTRGSKPLPVVLTGVPEGGNRFIDASGQWREGAYVPAYVRRYPFLLAKSDAGSDTLSLCIDPSADRVQTSQDKGNLFQGDEPTEMVRSALAFCESFEASARMTEAAMAQIIELGLLVDGQAQVRKHGSEPATLRGFQIISEEKLRGLAAPELSTLLQSGALALIYAHLFSLRHIAELVQLKPAAKSEGRDH